MILSPASGPLPSRSPPKHGRCLDDDVLRDAEAEGVPSIVGKAAKVVQDGDIALVAWSRAWIGEVDPLEVVAESPPEIAAVGPREVQACVGDGGLAKSS